MKKRVIAASALAVMLGGCASEPDLAPMIQMPVAPGDKISLIDVEVGFKDEHTLMDNVVQHPSHKVDINSSVVINVPEELFEEQAKIDVNATDYKTKDFFDEAEQQIERELMKNGFRVLSRSKFEAKLRSLRDEARCDDNQYRCLYSKVSPDVQPILADLKQKFDNGQISALEFSDQMKEFKDRMTVASAGKKRGANERELTDISEVIRAAESGDIQADYVLQINVFDTNSLKSVSSDLRYAPEVRDFMREHSNIRAEFEAGANVVSCAVIESRLNAKLVHVKTGEIVWIGEHNLNEFSAGVQNVTFELGVNRFVSNKREVERFVNDQNQYYARIARYGQEVRVPEFKYQEALVRPTISSGKCSSSPVIDDADKVKLAREVSKQLISTIKMNNS